MLQDLENKHTLLLSLSLSLALREEEGLSVLEKRVLRKIRGPRRMKMTARYTTP
jgi:hypothetical protein